MEDRPITIAPLGVARRLLIHRVLGRGSAALRPADARIKGGPRIVRPARTFGEVSPGEAFWYENANGLAEIAVNQGRADVVLGVGVGDEVGLGGFR